MTCLRDDRITKQVSLYITAEQSPIVVHLLHNAECLNETLFSSLSEARGLLAEWRDDYNRARPHSALANRTPEEFHAHALALAETAGNGQDFNPGLSL